MGVTALNLRLLGDEPFVLLDPGGLNLLTATWVGLREAGHSSSSSPGVHSEPECELAGDPGWPKVGLWSAVAHTTARLAAGGCAEGPASRLAAMCGIGVGPPAPRLGKSGESQAGGDSSMM
eukprot:scaffold114583_cov27-Prasinocladus_malaysianus.AAC.2